MPESGSVGPAFRLRLTATLRLRHLLALKKLLQTSNRVSMPLEMHQFNESSIGRLQPLT